MEGDMVVIQLMRSGRFPMVLAVGGLAVVVLAGIGLTVAQMRFDLSSRTVGAVAVPLFLATLGLMVWYAVGSQGTVAVGPDGLVVDPRGRPARTFPLPPRRTELLLYTPRDHALKARTFGPLLRVQTRDGAVSFAAPLPDVADRHPPAASWEGDPLPPDYLVSPRGLGDLARALGVDERVASAFRP